LPLDHLASILNFLTQWYLDAEADVDMFYPILHPPITPWDHEFNKIDSALYQVALM
jgi:hypothetical protein